MGQSFDLRAAAKPRLAVGSRCPRPSNHLRWVHEIISRERASLFDDQLPGGIGRK